MRCDRAHSGSDVVPDRSVNVCKIGGDLISEPEAWGRETQACGCQASRGCGGCLPCRAHVRRSEIGFSLMSEPSPLKRQDLSSTTRRKACRQRAVKCGLGSGAAAGQLRAGFGGRLGSTPERGGAMACSPLHVPRLGGCGTPWGFRLARHTRGTAWADLSPTCAS